MTKSSCGDVTAKSRGGIFASVFARPVEREGADILRLVIISQKWVDQRLAGHTLKTTDQCTGNEQRRRKVGY